MCFLLQGTRVWLSQSSVHIRPSRWDLRLMPDISQGSRIKPDGDQAGGKFKIRSKSKPGQGVFLLDSSKVKKHQLQIPGSQHGGRSTDSNRMRRDPIPWAASAVTHCTNTSTEGTPQCKATWKPWAQGQAPSDGTEEFTTHFQRAADNWSPQPSTGAVGHPCSVSTQGSRAYCTPKQLRVFEKAPQPPQGLFFARINWTDKTKCTWERKLKDLI